MKIKGKTTRKAQIKSCFRKVQQKNIRKEKERRKIRNQKVDCGKVGRSRRFKSIFGKGERRKVERSLRGEKQKGGEEKSRKGERRKVERSLRGEKQKEERRGEKQIWRGGEEKSKDRNREGEKQIWRGGEQKIRKKQE